MSGSGAPDPLEAMNTLHVDIGRKAAVLAMQVLQTTDPKDIPFASAVALLKFGVELERKALLGADDDGATSDPFESLVKTMQGTTTETPKEG